MRRSEQSDAQSGCAIDAFEHRARRAFAIRAGDVDKAEFFLRIANERGELARVFQPEIRAEHLQAVKKLDGFGIIHEPKSRKDSFARPTIKSSNSSLSLPHIFLA